MPITALRDCETEASAETGKQVHGAIDDARESVGNSAGDAQAYIHSASAELKA